MKFYKKLSKLNVITQKVKKNFNLQIDYEFMN
jgi:hypothetical protein